MGMLNSMSGRNTGPGEKAEGVVFSKKEAVRIIIQSVIFIQELLNNANYTVEDIEVAYEYFDHIKSILDDVEKDNCAKNKEKAKKVIGNLCERIHEFIDIKKARLPNTKTKFEGRIFPRPIARKPPSMKQRAPTAKPKSFILEKPFIPSFEESIRLVIGKLEEIDCTDPYWLQRHIDNVLSHMIGRSTRRLIDRKIAEFRSTMEYTVQDLQTRDKIRSKFIPILDREIKTLRTAMEGARSRQSPIVFLQEKILVILEEAQNALGH